MFYFSFFKGTMKSLDISDGDLNFDTWLDADGSLVKSSVKGNNWIEDSHSTNNGATNTSQAIKKCLHEYSRKAVKILLFVATGLLPLRHNIFDFNLSTDNILL